MPVRTLPGRRIFYETNKPFKVGSSSQCGGVAGRNLLPVKVPSCRGGSSPANRRRCLPCQPGSGSSCGADRGFAEPASDHESSAALEPYALVPTEAKGPLNPEDIFDSVLSKYGNENEKTASALNDLKPTASPTPENCGPLKPSLSDVDLKILEEAQSASPICKEGKSQQQRLNMVKKSINPTGKKQGQGSKKGKGKGQGKGKDKKKGKDSNSGKNTKPAAKATSSGAKAKDAKHAKSAGVKRQPPASSSKEQDQFVLRVPEVVPDPAKCDVPRFEGQEEDRRFVCHQRALPDGVYMKKAVAQPPLPQLCFQIRRGVLRKHIL